MTVFALLVAILGFVDRARADVFQCIANNHYALDEGGSITRNAGYEVEYLFDTRSGILRKIFSEGEIEILNIYKIQDNKPEFSVTGSSVFEDVGSFKVNKIVTIEIEAWRKVAPFPFIIYDSLIGIQSGLCDRVARD